VAVTKKQRPPEPDEQQPLLLGATRDAARDAYIVDGMVEMVVLAFTWCHLETPAGRAVLVRPVDVGHIIARPDGHTDVVLRGGQRITVSARIDEVADRMARPV